jgi:Methyltransferase domain
MQMLIRKASARMFAKPSVIHGWRTERMRAMIDLLRLPSGARVVDLGGSEFNWRLIEHDFHITLVNLPGFNPSITDPARFSSVEGDACDLRDVFADGGFDLVFSNSTIEHVGGPERRAAFAAECYRLAPACWVQTPSERFPIEIHTGVPFYWKLPEWTRRAMLRNWAKTLPGWVEMIRETRLVTEAELWTLFPDAKIYRENRYGFEKSYSFYRPFPTEPGVPRS